MRTSRLVVCLSVALIVLCTLVMTSSYAGQVALTWHMPTTNTDGSTLSDLAGYYVYYWQDGWETPQYVDAGDHTTATVTDLSDGATYHFAVTAYNTTGTESPFSNQLTVTVEAAVVDTDDDDLTDTDEAPADGIDSALADTDGDGLTDADEVSIYGTDPALADTDGDGLTDADEVTAYGTDPTLADTDGDGLDDGEEVTYWAEDWSADSDGDGLSNLLDPDADNDGFLDGDEQQDDADSAAVPSSPPSPPLPIEVGELVADHIWQRVTLQRSFTDPIVVVGGVQMHEDDSAVVRIRQVASGSFELQLREWIDTDGVSPLATVSYLVMERGVHILDDGAMVQADTFAAAGSGWVHVNYAQPFAETEPVVLTSSTTTNDPTPVTGRLQAVDSRGFEFLLQQAERVDKQHASETVSYIAWEPSSGTVGFSRFEVATVTANHNWSRRLFPNPFDRMPALLAALQTTSSRDTATAQCRDTDGQGTSFRVAEEQSRDDELVHGDEIIGYVVITPTQN